MTDAELLSKIRSKLLREVFDTVLDELIAIANGTAESDIPPQVRAAVGFNLAKMCVPLPAAEVARSDDGATVILGPDVSTVDDWIRLVKEQKLDKPRTADIIKLRN